MFPKLGSANWLFFQPVVRARKKRVGAAKITHSDSTLPQNKMGTSEMVGLKIERERERARELLRAPKPKIELVRTSFSFLEGLSSRSFHPDSWVLLLLFSCLPASLGVASLSLSLSLSAETCVS